MSEGVAAFVRDADRDRWLATLYAPEAVRPALLAVHALDLELAKVAATTTEPMIGRIRLAWWRERLEALDRGEVPAQPVLQALTADALPRGVTGAILAGFEDAWLAWLDGDDARHIEMRGQAVGRAMAKLLGGDESAGAALLTVWAAGEAARQGHNAPQVTAPRAPRALRPLAGLAALGRRDAARGGDGPEPRATAARQWTLLRAALIGR